MQTGQLRLIHVTYESVKYKKILSKADNVKRAKLLHKIKKEREKQALCSDNLLKDQHILRKKAEKNNAKVIDRSLLAGKEKISTVLLEMIKPILFTAQDEDDARGIITMGVVAWNFGVIRQTFGEKKFKDTMKAEKSNKNSWEIKILNEYIDIKCKQYSQYNDFIVDFLISFERDGSVNFSVLTETPNENYKTGNI